LLKASPLFRKRLLAATPMACFIVGDDPVEIENDRLQRALPSRVSSGPARYSGLERGAEQADALVELRSLRYAA
jgi:hypothetical protein